MFSTKPLLAGAVACAFLAGCAGVSQSSAPSSTLPQFAAVRPAASLGSLGVIPESSAKKGVGVWGVSVIDSVYVELGSNPVACSGPPSACNAYAVQKSFKANLTTSDSYGSASLKSTTALGNISANGVAASSGKGEVSSGSAANSGWEDTFTITSKTLAPGTPVSFTAALAVTSKPFDCTSSGGASLSIGSFSGMSFADMCGSAPPPVLTATINGTVGSYFSDGVGFYLSVGAGTPYAAGRFASGTIKAVYHLTPVTPGASYITASGKKYP
jgi:hypothetical protein